MQKGTWNTLKTGVVFTGLALGLTMGLGGCAKKGEVTITGSENEITIVAPDGYDTLSVATGHCKSFKKKAIFNGRGEGRGGAIVTNFKCMLR